MNTRLDKIRELSVDDLKKRQMELRESLFRLNFKKALGDTDTVGNIRRQKKELARVMTILRGRALGIEQ